MLAQIRLTLQVYGVSVGIGPAWVAPECHTAGAQRGEGTQRQGKRSNCQHIPADLAWAGRRLLGPQTAPSKAFSAQEKYEGIDEVELNRDKLHRIDTTCIMSNAPCPAVLHAEQSLLSETQVEAHPICIDGQKACCEEIQEEGDEPGGNL